MQMADNSGDEEEKMLIGGKSNINNQDLQKNTGGGDLDYFSNDKSDEDKQRGVLKAKVVIDKINEEAKQEQEDLLN
ncbi:MAG: hypothetical protein ACMG6E_09455 [Candidatus Roizmanbacteria bacterium]